MKRKNRIRDRAPGQVVLGYAVLAAMIVVALVPLVWTFLSSLKADPLMEPGMTLPKKVCLDGYVTVLTKLEIGRYFLNSLFCATISVLISLTHISMSSYVIARMRFRGRGLITALLMSTLFIPGIALTFPVYNLVNKLGLYNTRWGLIFIYSCSSTRHELFRHPQLFRHDPARAGGGGAHRRLLVCADLFPHHGAAGAAGHFDRRRAGVSGLLE